MPAALHTQLRADCLKYCLKHALFESGTVVVGVSGGADSLTLLHVLIALRNELDITLHVATLDHGIRGSDSAADAAYVRAIAEQWGVPITVGFADVPALAAAEQIGLEAAARHARYTFLARVAATVGAARIAVGHNRDDQAETVLMHVLRGSGLAGLRGMLPAAPLFTEPLPAELSQSKLPLILVRPLLNTPRAAIDAYAAQHNLQPRTDASNADPQYLRNNIRHGVLPMLKTLNPAVVEALTHTAETARADYETLTESIAFAAQITRADFLRLPLSLQRLTLRNAMHHFVPTASPRFEPIEAAIDWIARGTAGQQIAPIAGFCIRLTFDAVIFSDHESTAFFDAPTLTPLAAPIVVTISSDIVLADGWRWRIDPLSLIDGQALVSYDDPLNGVIALPTQAALELRTRRTGDRFCPQGLSGHSQKLSDMLINLKVPIAVRDRIFLLIINNAIGWFIAPTPDGLRARVADSFAVRGDAEQNIYRIRCWRTLAES